jgi:hypothetical protein
LGQFALSGVPIIGEESTAAVVQRLLNAFAGDSNRSEAM